MLGLKDKRVNLHLSGVKLALEVCASWYSRVAGARLGGQIVADGSIVVRELHSFLKRNSRFF